MIDLFFKSEVKNVEKAMIASGESEISLIEKAAKSVTEKLDASLSYAVVCGKGNNGGDGFAIACDLADLGAKIIVYLLSSDMTEAEAFYYQKCLDRSINVEKFDGTIANVDVVLDCVFGIGFHGAVKGEYLSAIEAINDVRKTGSLVYSVDIPSGLDADNGLADTCVIADKTFVIGKYKTGLILSMAKDVVGKLVFCNVGFIGGEPAAKLVEDRDLKTVLFERKNYSNKYDYGFIGVMGGSVNYSGAVKLSDMAACAASSGAGVVRTIVPEDIAPFVAPYLLESTLFTVPSESFRAKFSEKAMIKATEKLDSMCVGMGMTDDPETGKIVRWLLKNFKGTLVIDADGLNSVKDDPACIKDHVCKAVILTPHTGEFSRLCGRSRGEIERDPISYCRRFAKDHNVVLLLKGPATIVTDGDETLIVNAGTAGMATAGSGDVLSGVIASVCGYNEPSVLSVSCAAQICGVAAELSEKDISAVCHTASDTVAYIKRAITKITREN